MAIENLSRYIRELDEQGKIYKFYKSREWKTLRSEVLEDNHNECIKCASVGRYTRATMVHHVNEVLKRPDLALSKYYTDSDGNTKPNLLPLCDACHERIHNRFAVLGRGESLPHSARVAFKNQERW